MRTIICLCVMFYNKTKQILQVFGWINYIKHFVSFTVQKWFYRFSCIAPFSFKRSPTQSKPYQNYIFRLESYKAHITHLKSLNDKIKYSANHIWFQNINVFRKKKRLSLSKPIHATAYLIVIWELTDGTNSSDCWTFIINIFRAHISYCLSVDQIYPCFQFR